MANVFKELVEPSPESGQYKSVRFDKLVGGTTLYIQAGFLPSGLPRCWKLISANMGITTDGTVANRTPYINLQNELWFSVGGVKGKAITASSAGSTDLFQVGYVHTDAGPANSTLIGITKEGLVIQGKGRFDIYWSGSVAGDEWLFTALFKYCPPDPRIFEYGKKL